MNSNPRGVILKVALVILTLVLLIVTAVAAWKRPGEVRQPIAFNHAVHISEAGLVCVDCHLGALTHQRASVPNVGTCADCHDEALGESAAEAQVVEHVASGESIVWKRVYRMPDHVYFSHRRHAGIGEIPCARCHGEMAERTTPPRRPATDLTMDACIDCHQQSGVSEDCLDCHR